VRSACQSPYLHGDLLVSLMGASVGSIEALDGRLARVGRIDRSIREVPRAGRRTPAGPRVGRRARTDARAAEGSGERPGPSSGRWRGTTSWARFARPDPGVRGAWSRPSRCPAWENTSHPRFMGPKPHLGDRIQLDARLESEEEPASLNAGWLTCSESGSPSNR
jgi:hypothetical protein